MEINKLLNELLTYGLNKNIFNEVDFTYTSNKLIDLFKLDEFKKDNLIPRDLNAILDDLVTYAFEKDLLKLESIVLRDNFKAKIMDLIMDKPSEVIKKFNEHYKLSPIKATNYLYNLSINTNYIQTKRIEKNIKWKSIVEYGQLDLTINLSKPEKDSKTIMKQLNQNSGYPKCHLCIENEGFHGSHIYDSKANLRIIPLKLNDENWMFQYSSYSYFNEHAIIINKEHTPMVINDDTFYKLFDFIDLFPHYFVGSNAGLPIVGGSILNHEHYQAGRYRFPIVDAKEVYIGKFIDVEVFRLVWPMSTIRLISKNRNQLIDLSIKINNNWLNYENLSLSIVNNKKNQHNTITPIIRKEDNLYIVDLVLRNNYTNKQFPDGVFHPIPKFHNIKKENIGLIEAMGMGILPGRLKNEFKLIKKVLKGNRELLNDVSLVKHQEWINDLIKKYNNKDDINKFIQDETGLYFSEILKCAGVFKLIDDHIIEFEMFIKNNMT